MGAKEASKSIIRGAENLLYYFAAVIAVVIKQLTKAVIMTRTHYYDPKVSNKTKCPACGHRDCNLRFIRTQGAERGAIECTCTTCWAVFYQPLIQKAENWLL